MTLTQDPDSEIGVSGRDEFVTTNTYGFYGTSPNYRGVYMSGADLPFGGGPSTITQAIDEAGRVIEMENGSSWKYAQYQYLGYGTVVGFTGTATNNLYGSGGSADYSTYMDRFNRPIKNVWRGGSGNVDFVDMAASYNRVGGMTTLEDNVLLDATPTTPVPNFDWVTVFDDLRRPISKEEGELSGTSIATRSRIENFPRNLAGRIGTDQVSLDGIDPPDYTDGSVAAVDAGEMDDERVYNKRNELRSRSVSDKVNPTPPTTPITLNYDYNGNLINDGEKYEYTYDPFGRLTQIKNRGTSDVQAVYTYSGFRDRLSMQLDTNDSGNSGKADGVVDSNDPVYFTPRDDCGRRIAVYRGTDPKAKEVFYHHNKSFKGMCRGGPIMRERNQDLIDDPTTWATDAGDWEGHRDVFCTDFAGNIVALMGAEGLIEQYRYSASGVPLGIPLGDLNGDGFVDSANTDGDICKAAYSTYEVRADLNLDGVVDNDDLAIVTSADGNTTGRGKFSVASVRNVKGFGGCEVFGEGLHAQWSCGSEMDSGLGIGLTGASELGQVSFTVTAFPPPPPAHVIPVPTIPEIGPRLVLPGPAPTPTPTITVPRVCEPPYTRCDLAGQTVKVGVTCSRVSIGEMAFTCCSRFANSVLVTWCEPASMGWEVVDTPFVPDTRPPLDPKSRTGDCTEERWKELIATRSEAEGQAQTLGGCNEPAGSSDCSRFLLRATAWQVYCGARAAIMAECFRGGDARHLAELAKCNTTADKCMAKWSECLEHEASQPQLKPGQK